VFGLSRSIGISIRIGYPGCRVPLLHTLLESEKMAWKSRVNYCANCSNYVVVMLLNHTVIAPNFIQYNGLGVRRTILLRSARRGPARPCWQSGFQLSCPI
jgi:hypothetical protein